MDRIERNIRIGLARLYRQYQINSEKYDEIALLDLSHMLRLWVDMKDEVQDYLNSHKINISFPGYTLTKRLSRFLPGKEYVIAAMPGGVQPYRTGEKCLFHSPKVAEAFVVFAAKFEEDDSFTLYSFNLVYCAVNANARKIISDGIALKKRSFKLWMEAEAVRVNFVNKEGKLERQIIPREKLVARAANFLGGSHPQGMEETNNIFDPAIEYLMQYTLGGLPLPYFILLKTAKDILELIKLKKL